MSSRVVLERAVKLSGSRISPETLGQRLEVDAAQDADVLTIWVLDSTATGAAQLANAVAAAYEDVLAPHLLAPYSQQVVQDPPAVPNQPIPRSPGRPMTIGMLVGLLASAVLVWWLTRRQGAEVQTLDA
jgi:capsular polysaccharide biosynthesis protein